MSTFATIAGLLNGAGLGAVKVDAPPAAVAGDARDGGVSAQASFGSTLQKEIKHFNKNTQHNEKQDNNIASKDVQREQGQPAAETITVQPVALGATPVVTSATAVVPPAAEAAGAMDPAVLADASGPLPLVPGNALPDGGEALPRLPGVDATAVQSVADAVAPPASTRLKAAAAPAADVGGGDRQLRGMGSEAAARESPHLEAMKAGVSAGTQASAPRAASAAGDTAGPSLPERPTMSGASSVVDSAAPPPSAEAATVGYRGAAPGSMVAVARSDPGVARGAIAQARPGAPEHQEEMPASAAAKRPAGDGAARAVRIGQAAEPGLGAQRPGSDGGVPFAAEPVADAGDAAMGQRGPGPDRPAQARFREDQQRSAASLQAVAATASAAPGAAGEPARIEVSVSSTALPGDSPDGASAPVIRPPATGANAAVAERSAVATPEMPQRVQEGSILNSTLMERTVGTGPAGSAGGFAGDLPSRAAEAAAASSERPSLPQHAGVISGMAPSRVETVPLPAALAAVSVASPSGQWGGEIGERILWISHRGISAADIQLDPPELGPLQVQISSHRDGASVHFTTHSVVVRDLVEQSLPRLRDMLEASGMNLVNVDVSQQQGSGGREPSHGSTGLGAHRGGFADVEHPAVESSPADVPLGLIDFYA